VDFTEEESVPAESLFPIVTTRPHKKEALMLLLLDFMISLYL